MIDWAFLAGFTFGCICTAMVIRLAMRPRRTQRPTWIRPREVMMIDLGAAAHSEVADLAVSTGQFVSSVRSLKMQIDGAHELLRRGL